MSVLLVIQVISYKTDVTKYSVFFRCVDSRHEIVLAPSV